MFCVENLISPIEMVSRKLLTSIATGDPLPASLLLKNKLSLSNAARTPRFSRTALLSESTRVHGRWKH